MNTKFSFALEDKHSSKNERGTGVSLVKVISLRGSQKSVIISVIVLIVVKKNISVLVSYRIVSYRIVCCSALFFAKL